MRSAVTFSCLLLAISALPALAQTTGSLNGTVFDGQGAALPGAELVLTNVATGQTRQLASSSEGYFLFGDLSPAVYRLKVSATGFKELTLSSVTLNVGQQMTVRPTLEVGSISDQIEVTSTLAPVTTSSSSVAQVVDSQRIERLPLNGRNALQLVALVPGVVQTGRIGQFGATQLAFEVSGSRNIDMNFSLDGGFNMNTFYNSAADYPNPDALQEFSVSTRTVSAVFGRGSTSVSATTRSGTNQFHGTVFEFLRNKQLDARPYFAAVRTEFKRNQYGGSFGGPIVRNRLFFFASYQGTKERGSPGERRYRTLNAAERTGDFSGIARAIIDPESGAAFPGNRIPASRIRPYANRFISTFLPAPNSGTDFYAFGTAQKLDQDQVVTKVDYSVNSKDRLSFRYLYNNLPQRGVSNNPLDSSWVQDLPTRAQSWNLGYVHIFSPSLITDTHFTHIRNVFGVRTTNSPDFSLRKIGLDVRDGSAISNFGLTPDSSLGVSGYFSAYPGVPTRDIVPSSHFVSNTSWVSGKHSLQVGVEIYKNRVNELQNFFTGGSMNFTGGFSGNAAADFMLGKFNDYRQISPVVQRIRQTLPSVYIQEDYRIKRNLTINIGLRYDPFRPWISEDSQFSRFDPGKQSKVFPNAPAGLLYPGDEGLPPGIVSPHYKQFAPRVGFAWDVFGTGKTSIRSGFGLYYVPITQGISFNRFTLILPFTLDLIVTGGDAENIFGRAPFNGRNPYPVPERTDVQGLRNLVFTPTAGHNSFSLPFKTQTDRQWNFSIQQAIGQGSVLEVNYVGSSSAHLFTTDEANPAIYILGVDAAGRPLSTVSNIQQRRLYPQFGQINDTKSALSSNYNSLQASFNRRFARGFSVLSSYAWSKSLGVVGSSGAGSNGQRDPFRKQLDYGPQSNDIAHNSVTSFIWDLPFASKTSPLLQRMLLRGWQLNGINTLRSGFPFTIRSGVDNSLSGVGGNTADQIGNRTLPDGRSKGEAIQKWFNTAAFIPNKIGTVGNVGINSVRGPGFWNVDIGASRNFLITETKRVEFRASFFNLFNHGNLGLPNATQSSPTFGRITGMANDARVVELGLKFAF